MPGNRTALEETGGLDYANLFYGWVRIRMERRGNRKQGAKITALHSALISWSRSCIMRSPFSSVMIRIRNRHPGQIHRLDISEK